MGLLMCLTWVFSTSTPLDEADNEEDEDDESDGTHQANEPALGGDVHLVYVGWRHGRTKGGAEGCAHIELTWCTVSLMDLSITWGSTVKDKALRSTTVNKYKIWKDVKLLSSTSKKIKSLMERNRKIEFMTKNNVCLQWWLLQQP